MLLLLQQQYRNSLYRIRTAAIGANDCAAATGVGARSVNCLPGNSQSTDCLIRDGHEGSQGSSAGEVEGFDQRHDLCKDASHAFTVLEFAHEYLAP
jgi:hypothetical protein